MIEINLTATEFDEFVFDDVTQQTVGPDLVTLAVRVVQELSDVSITEERPLTPAEQKAAAETGRKLWPGRIMRGERATFSFTVNELKLLIFLLERAAPRHPLLVLPDFCAMIERLSASLLDSDDEPQG